MKILGDLKKIGAFMGGQLKSTIQMLAYLKKMKTQEVPEKTPPEENSDQNKIPEKKKTSRSKKEKATPPNLKTDSEEKEEKSPSSPKKKARKELPPLNILTDEKEAEKKTSWFAWVIRVDFSNPYIAVPAIAFLLVVAILIFWIALDRLFPTPTSHPQIESESEQISVSKDIEEEQDGKKDQSQQEQNQQVETQEDSPIEETKQESQSQEAPETTIKESPSHPVEASHEEASTEIILSEPNAYQPILDLETTKGVLRTINPHFFMQTPPLNSKGTPTNLLPRVAIIVYNVGMNDLETDLLLSELSEDVTLSLSPYASNIDNLIEDSKSHGYCVLVQMPWEDDSLYTDQGNLTILTGLSQEKMMEALNKYKIFLGKADGFFAEGGSKLLRHPEDLSLTLKFITVTKNCLVAPPDVLMTSLHEKAAETKVNYASTTLVDPDFKDITAIESLAKRTGFAILAFPTGPKIIPQINEWIDRLEKLGIDVVPVSMIVKNRG